jgi:hypothetical protein
LRAVARKGLIERMEPDGFGLVTIEGSVQKGWFTEQDFRDARGITSLRRGAEVYFESDDEISPVIHVSAVSCAPDE